MRELRVEDALLYLDQVKVEFGDRPHIYNEFLDIMKTFKTQQIDTPGVIQRVSNLFQGNKRLVLGFNTFLPEGYKIELPLDGEGPPVAVFHGIGGTVTHILTNPPPPPRSEPAAGAAGVGGGVGGPPAGSAGLGVASRPDVGGPQQMHLGGQPAAAGMRHAGPGGGPLGHQQPMPPAGMPGQPPSMMGIGQAKVPPGEQQQQQPPPVAGVAGFGRSAMPPQHGQPAHMQMHSGMPRNQQPPSMAELAARARTDAQHRAAPGGPGRGAGGGAGQQHNLGPGGRGRGGPLRPGGIAGAGGLAAGQAPPGGLDGSFPARMGPGVAAQQRPPGVVVALPPVASAVAQQPAVAAQQQQGGQQPPLEFDHAINYVTTIKKRFSSEPETYKKFLEILHTYQKEQRGIKEVLDEVSLLFEDHPDLLKEFTYFLPDAVQAQAKAQLDQAAKESEARKAARSSKEAITQIARGMQRPEAAASRGQAALPPPRVPNYPTGQTQIAVPFAPFGATQGRTEEREEEIQRKAHFGFVSFAPVNPPKRGELNPSQAVAKLGRPTNMPLIPKHANTSEGAFFLRAKKHLNRKELAPDKPAGSRRHTPYTEFLKCLHLFAAGVVNKEELVLLMKGLFMHGHAPKTGANAGGGVSNPTVAGDAHTLVREFEDLLIGRGPYADQETNFKDKSKYGSLRTRDFDYSTCEKPTPSYRTYPSDYPQSLFITNPGETEMDASVLNGDVVCVGVERSSRKHMTSSPEDYDAVRMRRNAYEEVLFRIEDERYEVDMAIERNNQAMRQVEPFAEEVSTLRQNEEKDGQPIGRLQWQPKRYAMDTIPINAIGRIYGEHGDEVLQHLVRNPLVVLPTVYQRLRQKDSEWRKAKLELRARWNTLYEENYEGSTDYLCYFYRKELERSFTAHHLLDECKRAKHFSKHPNKVKNHPAIQAFTPEFLRKNTDADALLFQPHIDIKLGKAAMVSHHDAFKMITTKIKSSSQYTKVEREAVGRIWAEFMLPWFGYPVHWVLDELRESFRGKVNTHVVKYAPGQKVRTAFGDGSILSYMEGNPSMGCRYRVKLPFGIASVRPSAIMHSLPQADRGMMVRRNGVMGKDESPDGTGEGLFAEKLNKKFELMFATESVYVFMRLYCLLVSLLTDTREYLKASGQSADPVDSYFIPPPIREERNAAPQPTADFPGVISMLGKVVAREVETKEFESYCRRVSKVKVHQMAVLPKLIDKCTDALLNVVKEDALLSLFDYCLHREMDPVQLRSLCLSVTPEASYRIQYETSKAHIFFSYLPEGETLLTVPQEEDSMQEDEEPVEEEDEVMKDTDDIPFGDASKPVQTKAEASSGDNGGSDPPSKRVKLK